MATRETAPFAFGSKTSTADCPRLTEGRKAMSANAANIAQARSACWAPLRAGWCGKRWGSVFTPGFGAEDSTADREMRLPSPNLRQKYRMTKSAGILMLLMRTEN